MLTACTCANRSASSRRTGVLWSDENVIHFPSGDQDGRKLPGACVRFRVFLVCKSSTQMSADPYFSQLISWATSGTLYWPDPNVDRIAALKPKRRHGEENMRHRAILVLLFAIATAVSGSTQQRNGHTDISGSGGQLDATWRLISRFFRL